MNLMESDDADKDTLRQQGHLVDVPDVAIRWIIQYSCDTNSNLAALSNVNRHWRSLVFTVIRDMLFSVIDDHDGQCATMDRKSLSITCTTLTTTCSEEDKVHDFISQYKFLSKLLLPEMALEIIRTSNRRTATIIRDQNNGMNTDSSTFCLAWFPPEGIQVQNINLDAFSDEELFSSDYESSSGENDNEEMAFYRERLHQRASEMKIVRGSSNNNAEHNVIATCSHEWRGYRRAIDVLAPLGFSYMFVKSIIHLAVDIAHENKNTVYTLLESTNRHETTYAVRGAVFARPYLFCLCWDADQAESKIRNQMSNLEREQSEKNIYKLEDLKRRKRMHDRARRTKMRQVLPRVIVSSPIKNPVLQDPFTGIMNGRRQRCLQFLNADGSRAVYLRTPPFACGKVKCPITMFIVGIATEDGCFVSGLENRFEFGHLHGIDDMDKSIDMSPICMCAEQSNVDNDCETETYDGRDAVRSYSEDISSDSSCDEYQIQRKGSILCQCQIQYQKQGDDSSAEQSTSEINQANIMRGQLGPGRWHCYTAIFDGANSTIRVDGCTERIKNIELSKSKSPIGAVLDGLTIGSDHCFEMPLCCGAGSEGEGEGSIAELAVFNGALPIEDVEKYERHLMQKHGVIHGQLQIYPQSGHSAVGQNIGNQWQEDLWRRQAHAMIVHPPHHEIGGASIPLRVAARHRSVAWHRSNEVTGKIVKVSRIGSKLSHGSSDW